MKTGLMVLLLDTFDLALVRQRLDSSNIVDITWTTRSSVDFI